MRHLPDHPPFVLDRLSAVSNVPMQLLVSAGIVAVILTAAALTESDGAAGFVDSQKTASISATAQRFTVGDRGRNTTDTCLLNLASKH